MDLLGLFRKKVKKEYAVGSTVTFGMYFHENAETMSPIEWTVLESGKTDVLLISRYCLDTIRFCRLGANSPEDCVWENSFLRSWLNEDFFRRAFRDAEREKILETTVVTDASVDSALHKNKVFILSEAQTAQYFPDREARKGIPTPYAVARGAFVDTGHQATGWWVLPHVEKCGGMNSRFDYPCMVLPDGEPRYHSRLMSSPGSFATTVRPVIRIRK